jgi:hypothetical protein
MGRCFLFRESASCSWQMFIVLLCNLFFRKNPSGWPCLCPPPSSFAASNYRCRRQFARNTRDIGGYAPANLSHRFRLPRSAVSGLSQKVARQRKMDLRSASRHSSRLELDRSSNVSRTSQSRRSSSAAPVKASAFLSPQRKKSALDFELTPTRNVAPASPSHTVSAGETFVKVFALLCQHEDRKQQEAVVAKASDVSHRPLLHCFSSFLWDWRHGCASRSTNPIEPWYFFSFVCRVRW